MAVIKSSENSDEKKNIGLKKNKQTQNFILQTNKLQCIKIEQKFYSNYILLIFISTIEEISLRVFDNIRHIHHTYI